MGQLFVNEGRGQLASGIDSAATSITLVTGNGIRFPAANTGLEAVSPAADWFKVVFTDVSGLIEIAYVRTHASDSDLMSNIIRGQEGTTARSWGVGSVVGCRLTAADIQTSLNAAASVAEQVADLTAQVALVVSGNAVPAGMIAHWPGATPPSGWLLRHGQAVSRTENPGLFALIGTTHGVGDGSTTFNLPDDVTNNRFIRSSGGSLAVGATQDDQNKSHTHAASTNSAGSHNHSEQRTSISNALMGVTAGSVALRIDSISYPTANTGSNGAHSHTVTVNADGGTEARPFARAYLPIIKGG